MPPTLPIHHVYTEQLLPLGHGFPLWDAEPEDKKFEVEIGTVGRIDSGKFWLLFNAMKPADDPYQKHGVPATYEPLSLPQHAPQGPWEKIKFPLVVSQTVCNRDIAAALQAGSPDGSVSLGGSLKFDCRENTGAFLLLERPAIALVLPAKDRIVRYMRDNFDHWLEFANAENGLSLRPEEIYFVHGTVKTSKWAAGAFHGNCRNREGSLKAQLMEVGNFDLSISVSTEDYTRMEYNYGPTGRDLSGASGDAAVSSGPSTAAAVTRKCDQCIFFNYFKAKKRLFIGPKYMAAAAGPHQLPPPDRNDFMTSDATLANEDQWFDEDFEEMSGAAPESLLCDPVDFLLDYILEHSEARIAIACDTDLYALFRESGYPLDVAAALEQMKPNIHVDDCGGGTLVVDSSDSRIPYRLCDPMNQTFEQSYSLVSRDNALEHASTGDQTPKPGWSRFPPVNHPSPESTSQWNSFWDSSESGHWDDQKTLGYISGLKRVRRKQDTFKRPREQSWDDIYAGRTATAVSSSGKWIAHGYDDGAIVLQEVSRRALVCAWDSHPDCEGVSALAFSRDSARLASATDDGVITIWAVEEDKHLATLRGHTEATTILAWSSDGTHIASASDDFTVRLWDAETYRPLFLLVGHDEPITVLNFSPNGRCLVSAGEDCFCLVWSVASGELLQELYGHEDMVRAAAFDAYSTRLATSSDDKSVRIWSVETGVELLALEAHRSPVWTVAFSRDGRRVLTVSSTTAKIHDAFTGERKFTFKGADAAGRACQVLERRLE